MIINHHVYCLIGRGRQGRDKSRGRQGRDKARVRQGRGRQEDRGSVVSIDFTSHLV